jgi:hypothetical protein
MKELFLPATRYLAVPGSLHTSPQRLDVDAAASDNRQLLVYPYGDQQPALRTSKGSTLDVQKNVGRVEADPTLKGTSIIVLRCDHT